MRFAFRPLPGLKANVLRPVIDVKVEGIDPVPLGCLIDSGSLHNRFGAWVAREAGIELEGSPEEVIGLGGIRTTARTVTIGLRLGDIAWEAPVSFCEPWPWDFNVLGQEGFLRWFRVCLDVADNEIEVEVVTSS